MADKMDALYFAKKLKQDLEFAAPELWLEKMEYRFQMAMTRAVKHSRETERWICPSCKMLGNETLQPDNVCEKHLCELMRKEP